MGVDLMTAPARFLAAPSYATRQEARAAGVLGGNLVCNRCGRWGALWYHGQRPGWGCMALCGQHATELRDELIRHRRTLTNLRKVNYEQP